LLLSQQPPAHEDALQTQAPLAQVWPVAQVAQAAPPMPQVCGLEVWQWPVESQQPFGHEVALQTQAPCALHAWFAAHGTHWAPFAPQAVGEAVVHWPFAQQPAQLMLPQLHAPDVQVWPVAHMPQTLPPDPHALVDCDDWATQRPCESQQPFGHEVGLQTHVPADPHACPDAQAPQLAPAAPQAFMDWPAYSRQVPFAWQQPFAQEADVQAHLPVVSQVWPAAQGAHAAPALPQAWSLAGWQRPALVQQPLQLARSHAHVPDVHVCEGAQTVQAAPAVPHAAAVGGLTHWPF
jgi:hypothetical protein